LQRAARTTAEADVVNDPRAAAASVDVATMAAVENALSARALEQAAIEYESGGSPAPARSSTVARRRCAPTLRTSAPKRWRRSRRYRTTRSTALRRHRPRQEGGQRQGHELAR